MKDTQLEPFDADILGAQAESARPTLPENTIYHVGVSGGKDSTAVLLWMIHESGIPREMINATFADTGNEHEWTYEHIEMLSKTVHPIETLKPELDFYALVRSKGTFPSAKRRFCTEALKIWPAQDHINYLREAYDEVVAVSGVRADESEDRKHLPEWDYSGNLLTLQWRPLIRWSFADVIEIHKKYSVPLNPLYAIGAERVGCYPCINSRKHEVRTIALNFPERIKMIQELEDELWMRGKMTAFFHASKIPERFRTRPFTSKKTGESMMVARITDVVEWSMTGSRAKGSYLDDPPEPISCSSGFCE